MLRPPSSEVSPENSTEGRRRHPLRRRILWKLAELFGRRAAIDEPEFDRKYGISTGGYIEQNELEIATKEGENLVNRINAKEACEDSLDELASAKLKEGGADQAAAAATLAQWKEKWFAAHP